VLSYPFRRAVRLNYYSQSLTVALENGNGHLRTTWQMPELMFHNNGFLHHNVIIAVGQCFSTPGLRPKSGSPFDLVGLPITVVYICKNQTLFIVT